MTAKQEQINIILEDMDFDKIHSVMKHLDWTWTDSETGEKRVPNSNELAITAEYCINKAWKSENKICNNGGFECEIINNDIEIRFVIEKITPLFKSFT